MIKHTKLIITALSISLSSTVFAANNDSWTYGIGTGLYGLHINGEAGFNTQSGPISFDASLSTDDVDDLMESAFGFGGFAKKGPWTIQYSLGTLELGDSDQGELGDSNSVASIDFTHESTSAEISVNYDFVRTRQTSFGVLVGLTYTSHEYDISAKIDGLQLIDLNVKENWTDFIIGLTHSHALTPTIIWSSRIDVGTEGRAFADTGVTWVFSKNWATRLFTSFKSVDYENERRGHKDWFMYDANEAGLGLSISYLF